MDILISSNLERFLLELCQGDCKQVAGWMKQLSAEGKYDIGAERLASLQKIFYGGFADDERTAQTIQKAWQDEKYLLDPHTAVAACVADDYRRDTGDEKPMLIVSTASPYKFASDVADALNVTVEGDAFAAASILENYTGVKAPDQVAKLKDLPVLHSRICDKEKMGEAVLAGFND